MACKPMVALRPLPVVAPAAPVVLPERSPQLLLDVFLRRWSLRTPRSRLLRLVSELNRAGWNCAVVDGGSHTAAWQLLTGSGRNRRVQASSIADGLHQLEALQRCEQFDLVILHEILCSPSRVRDWLAWTPGRGAVLWVRQGEAVLLEEDNRAYSPRLEALGRVVEKILHLLDRWGR